MQIALRVASPQRCYGAHEPAVRLAQTVLELRF